MYSRMLGKAPDFLLEDTNQGKKIWHGKKYRPRFGSYIGTPKSIGINGVRFPYGIIPLPTFITNMRIRSNFSFVFSTDEFIGSIDILDVKLAGFYEMSLWNKKTNLRYSYRGITGIHRHFIPKNLEKAICCTRKRRRYIRILWDKEKNRFGIVFRMKGDGVKPNFNGSFLASYDDSSPALTSVLPFPTTRRCYVSYQRKIDADCKLFSVPGRRLCKKENDGTLKIDESCKAKCLLSSVRAYFKFRNYSDASVALGFAPDEEGKEHEIEFRLTTHSSFLPDSNDYNENVLFCDDEITVLPSVRITHEYGATKKWVIQDTEGMVDLVFTPSSSRKKFISAIIFESQYNFEFGTFDGVVFTKDGKSITIKDFPGVCKNTRIRL